MQYQWKITRWSDVSFQKTWGQLTSQCWNYRPIAMGARLINYSKHCGEDSLSRYPRGPVVFQRGHVGHVGLPRDRRDVTWDSVMRGHVIYRHATFLSVMLSISPRYSVPPPRLFFLASQPVNGQSCLPSRHHCSGSCSDGGRMATLNDNSIIISQFRRLQQDCK